MSRGSKRARVAVDPKAIAKIDLDQIGDEFRIADYGSAQGENSLLPMKTAIAEIKKLASKSGREPHPISVTHTDLPTNDWTTLFQTVLSSPDSYLVGEKDVFCFASGTPCISKSFRRITSRWAIPRLSSTG